MTNHPLVHVHGASSPALSPTHLSDIDGEPRIRDVVVGEPLTESQKRWRRGYFARQRGAEGRAMRASPGAPTGFQRQRLEALVEAAIDILDDLDAFDEDLDPTCDDDDDRSDWEPECEDEGAQCDDEGWDEGDGDIEGDTPLRPRARGWAEPLTDTPELVDGSALGIGAFMATPAMLAEMIRTGDIVGGPGNRMLSDRCHWATARTLAGHKPE